LEQFELHSIIQLLAKLTKMGLGSVDFWRVTVRWIMNLLSYDYQYSVIVPETGMYINLLTIVVVKNFKEETREEIYQKITYLLEIDHYWSLSKLLRLASVLSYNKIGEPKLWLLIEHRLYPYILKIDRERNKSSMDELLGRLALQFSSMNRGSY
jgi:hypothetical protein